MKLTYVAILFAATASALDIGSLLKQAGPLLKRAKCVGPCLSKATNRLPCDSQGPLDTICGNLNKIKADSYECAKKCGIDQSTQGWSRLPLHFILIEADFCVATAFKVADNLCSKGFS